MKAIFAGTPEFARVALERMHAAGIEITLVLTQPDRPAGRGMKLQASPVKAFAEANGIAVAQPRSLRLDGKYPQDASDARSAIEAAGADVMVVAAYGLILPQWVLDAMRHQGGHGCLNIHASLLPRWRGAAPIHRAIEAGDAETGVTIMQMDAGLDTGDMLLTERVAIESRVTTASLHDTLADVGGRMIVQALEQAAAGMLVATPQPVEGVTYAHKIDKSEAAIDWSQSALVIERRVRAFDPFPGAISQLEGEPLKIWSARVVEALDAGAKDVEPGTVFGAADGVDAAKAGTLIVATGDGAIELLQVQRPGGKRLAVSEFLRGFDIKDGMTFDITASAPRG